MIWLVSFGLSAGFIAAGAVCFFIRRKQGKNEVRYLGAGVFLASVTACYPVMRLSEQVGFAAAMSVSQGIRMFVVDTGVSDILKDLNADVLGNLFYPYKTLICLLYLLAPVFTLSVVLRYFSNFFERFRLLTKRRSSLYVFSDLNTRSLEIAAELRKTAGSGRKWTEIIFCRSSEKDDLNTELEDNARELNAIFVSREILHLRLQNKKRNIAYFLISEDEDKNIDDTLQMIENMTGNSSWVTSGRLNQRNTSIYCYATSEEAEVLLDSKDKEEIRVVLMDEVRDAVYEHLYKHPLYTGMDPLDNMEGKGKISLLIAGGGNTGIKFLKAAVWCGQMQNFDLDIHLIDVKGNLIRKKLEEECPELFMERSGYSIDIHKGNIFSNMAEKYLNMLDDINYCVVCLGEDEDNIRASIWLRKFYYMRRNASQPHICAYLESSRKRAALWNLYENTRTKERLYYNIIPFGRRGMCFGDRSDAAFTMEYLGLGVQAHYWRLTRESGEEERREAVKNFYDKQSNRRSSIASGIHIGTKLWELGLGIMRVPHDKKLRQLFDQCIHPVDFAMETEGKLNPYYNLEHERWMAYIRTEGWRLASKGSDSIDNIRECYEDYCTQFKNQNYMIKLHPALVPLKTKAPGAANLQEVDDMIVEVNEKKGLGRVAPDYVQSDVQVVAHIGDIVSGSWCGPQGITIHGIVAKEGECIIARLGDINRYYMSVYVQRKAQAGPEELLTLREEIKRCSYGVLRTESDNERRAEAYESLTVLAHDERREKDAQKYEECLRLESKELD